MPDAYTKTRLRSKRVLSVLSIHGEEVAALIVG